MHLNYYSWSFRFVPWGSAGAGWLVDGIYHFLERLEGDEVDVVVDLDQAWLTLFEREGEASSHHAPQPG